MQHSLLYFSSILFLLSKQPHLATSNEQKVVSVSKNSFTHLKYGTWKLGVSPLPEVHRCCDAPSHRQRQMEMAVGHAGKAWRIDMMLKIASQAKREISTENTHFQGQLKAGWRTRSSTAVLNEEVSPGRSDSLEVLPHFSNFILDGFVMSASLKILLIVCHLPFLWSCLRPLTRIWHVEDCLLNSWTQFVELV